MIKRDALKRALIWAGGLNSLWLEIFIHEILTHRVVLKMKGENRNIIINVDNNIIYIF